MNQSSDNNNLVVPNPTTHKKLNRQERLFVEAYAGDELEAMQLAGYEGNPNYLRQKARELLKRPSIMQAIKDRSRYLVNMGQAISTRNERMMLWTSIMNNHDPHYKPEHDSNGIPINGGKQPNIPLHVRLKAAELVGKAEGDFITQIDINHNVTISDIVKQSYVINDRPLEDIEAEYMEIREQRKREKDSPSRESEPNDLGDLI